MNVTTRTRAAPMWLAALAVSALTVGSPLLAPLSAIRVPPRHTAPRPVTDGGGAWPTFHHDAKHLGVSAETTVGASSAPDLNLKWSSFIGLGPIGWPGITASPVVARNPTSGKLVAYVASTGTPASVDALDIITGAVLWTFQPGAAVEGGFAVSGNTVYVGSDDDNLYAIDATSGLLQCSFNTGGRVIAAPVVVDPDGSGSVVYFGDAGPSENNNAGHEWAITAVGNPSGDCQLRWVFNSWGNKGTGGTKTGSWSPPAIGVDRTGRPLLVFGSSNPDDSVYALDARTGVELWRYQTSVGKQHDVGAGPTIGSPGTNGFADGVVYIDGKTKVEYALDLETGQLIWDFDLALDAGVNTNSVSTAALVHNKVVVGYADHVYALNAATGALVWRSPPTSGNVLTSPAAAGGADEMVVFAGDTGGVEHAYRLRDGSELFSIAPCTKILSSTAIAAGMVFFGCSDGNLEALG